MFSGYLKKVDDMHCKALLGVAAGLVFLCQLLAMALVVNAQVEKAHIRNAQYNAAQVALADCSNSYSGAARSQCIEQVNATLNPYPTYTPETETRAFTQLAVPGNATPLANATMHSLMRASFASRQ